MSSIETSLSFSEKIKLFRAGLIRISSRFVLLLIALITLVIMLVFISKFDRKRGDRTKTEEPVREARRTREDHTVQQPERELPLFGGGIGLRVSAGDREYIEALKALGLHRGASLSEIKSAYRSKVKALHPDSGANEGVHDPQRFQEVTQAYDKILEIRGKLGFDE